MKVNQYNIKDYYCWYCGDGLKKSISSLPSAIIDNFNFEKNINYPEDPNLWLVCMNHKFHFILYSLFENLDGNVVLDSVYIFKDSDNKWNYLLFYPDSLYAFFFRRGKEIRLDSSIWTKESDPIKIYGKAQIFTMLS